MSFSGNPAARGAFALALLCLLPGTATQVQATELSGETSAALTQVNVARIKAALEGQPSIADQVSETPEGEAGAACDRDGGRISEPIRGSELERAAVDGHRPAESRSAVAAG